MGTIKSGRTMTKRLKKVISVGGRVEYHMHCGVSEEGRKPKKADDLQN
jgi:hypothetical protein